MELSDKQDKLVKAVKKNLPEFYEESERLSVHEMEDRIVRYLAELTNAQEELEKNPGYKMLKEQVSEIEGPMKDLKRLIDMKIRYLLIAIEEKGGSPNTSSILYKMAANK